MAKQPKPKYVWWAKMDSWSAKEAALLLHNIDPYSYRSVRLAESNIPPELEEIQRTYWLLQSVSWKERYHYHPDKRLHPLAVVLEAVSKELGLPKRLHDAVMARFKGAELLAEKPAVRDKTPKVSEISPIESHQSLSTRERRAFLKAIGLLVKLLLESNLKDRICVRGTKPSAFQITQLILEKADSLGMELEGLKSMDRKITEALELLAEESLTTL